MKASRAEAERWWPQSENDLAYARHGRRRCAILDQCYIPARYPNGIPEGAPFEVYTKDHAAEALETAAAVLEHARQRLAD